MSKRKYLMKMTPTARKLYFYINKNYKKSFLFFLTNNKAENINISKRSFRYAIKQLLAFKLIKQLTKGSYHGCSKNNIMSTYRMSNEWK